MQESLSFIVYSRKSLAILPISLYLPFYTLAPTVPISIQMKMKIIAKSSLDPTLPENYLPTSKLSFTGPLRVVSTVTTYYLSFSKSTPIRTYAVTSTTPYLIIVDFKTSFI